MPYSVSVATSREFKQDLRILIRKHGTENFVRTKAATQMHGYKKLFTRPCSSLEYTLRDRTQHVVPM